MDVNTLTALIVGVVIVVVLILIRIFHPEAFKDTDNGHGGFA